MTFDETIEKFEQEANEYNGLVPMETIYELILDLKEDYAPTIEMTKNKVKEVNSIVHEVGEKFEQDELPDDIKITDKMIELEDGFVVLKYLNVILHPEIIKMVDE